MSILCGWSVSLDPLGFSAMSHLLASAWGVKLKENSHKLIEEKQVHLKKLVKIVF